MKSPGALMRILIVDDERARADALAVELAAADAEIAGIVGTRADVVDLVARLKPDLVIIDVNAPSRDMIDGMRVIDREQPVPIVLFTKTSDESVIAEAIAAGVSSYIVGAPDPARVRSIVNIAIARFRNFHRLRTERDEARSALADRKIIDRAKGVLMQERGLSEEEAYRNLRKLAMDQGKRLVDVARQLLTFAELLKG